MRWMAKQGFNALGIDLIKATVLEARAQAAADPDCSARVRFLQGDVFQLPATLGYSLVRPGFDFVFDSQCFHCLRTVDETAAVEAICNLMRPGALLFVLTGWVCVCECVRV